MSNNAADARLYQQQTTTGGWADGPIGGGPIGGGTLRPHAYQRPDAPPAPKTAPEYARERKALLERRIQTAEAELQLAREEIDTVDRMLRGLEGP